MAHRDSATVMLRTLVLLLTLAVCDHTPESISHADIIGLGRVIDGDSLTVNSIEIRLWGIDAVEYKQICTRAGKPWNCGQAARNALAQKINGAALSCQRHDTDSYGRTVAECFVEKESINAWMVRNGWALAYRRYSKKFVVDEQSAKSEQRGIWQSQFVMP